MPQHADTTFTEVPPALPAIKVGAPTVAIPPATTSLIGREGEQNVLIHLLAEERHRMVTVVGAGGMGKTRLASEVAAALSSHFVDGATFVSLTPLQGISQLSATVAEALQIDRKSGSADITGQLHATLQDRQLLLVLDNFEHLLEQDALQAVE
ncbi:MAG: AAA family ATPase [Caldilineaceae bacterium]